MPGAEGSCEKRGDGPANAEGCSVASSVITGLRAGRSVRAGEVRADGHRVRTAASVAVRHFVGRVFWPDQRARTGRCQADLALHDGGTGLSAWERVRQSEPWVHALLEAGHCADPVAGEGEDEQAGSVANAGRTAKVRAESRLTVRSRWDEVEPPARVEDA